MRCLAVCQTELAIRMLDEILLPSFEVEFLVESKPIARRLHDAGMQVMAGDLRRTDAVHTNRKNAFAQLSGRLGDQLLEPVGKDSDAGASLGDDEFVAAGVGSDRRGKDQAGVVGGVRRQDSHHFFCLVEQIGDVDAG